MVKGNSNRPTANVDVDGKEKGQIIKVNWHNYSEQETLDRTKREESMDPVNAEDGNTISFTQLAKVRAVAWNHDQQFVAYMTNTRSTGSCKMVFIQKINGYFDIERFHLRFDQRGIIDHEILQTIYQDDVTGILEKGQYHQINYHEAILFVRDAMLQNYKYDSDVQWLDDIQSVHLMRATYGDFDRQDHMENIQATSADELINTYLKAIQNKDASLIYGLLSTNQKKTVDNRDVFMMMWNHELEDMGIVRSNSVIRNQDSENINLDVFILAIDYKKRFIEIALLVEVVCEANGYRMERMTMVESKLMDKDSKMNPANAKQYVVVLDIDKREPLEKYLGEQKAVAVTGEFARGRCYKWFKEQSDLEQGITIEDHFKGQIILTDKQLIIYGSNLPEVNIIQWMITNASPKYCRIAMKYIDSIGQIYQTILVEDSPYPRGAQSLEHYYNIGRQHYQQLLLLVCEMPDMVHYQYCNNHFTFYHEVENQALEIVFYPHYATINSYTQPIEQLAKEWSEPSVSKLSTFVQAVGERKPRLPKNVEMLRISYKDKSKAILKPLMRVSCPIKLH